ncbi:alpha/beta hydrolase [Salinivibrio kushneri]|uniref:Alpha/beta hydrolase n=1 Tax=Salinivibrio kushneri TaxID=1908198 RepID=A0AA47KJB4_9GAMM|nr:alpha/beta hydrolase [Salinivibrio kushneri]WBA07897.1 alpha/beta hydrolase [Salinivibrio kushneri]
MLFITSRIPEQGSHSEAGRWLSFDNQNTDISKWVYFCQRAGQGEYQEITAAPFMAKLKALPAHTQILFWLHGYNNQMESHIFPMAQTLQHQCDRLSPNAILVVPIIWPCDEDGQLGVIDDYWDDQLAATASGLAFSRLLAMFDEWRRAPEQQTNPCKRRMNLLAHSMGNRTLISTFHHWHQHAGLDTMPQWFRHIFMMAADVDNQALESHQPGRAVLDAAKQVHIYYAADDLAMAASKVVNVRHRTVTRRLGMTGPENLDALPANKVTVTDCDAFNDHFDPHWGHTYFLTDDNGHPSPLIEQMMNKMIGT